MSAVNVEHAEMLGQVDLFSRLDRVSLARLVGFTETALYADGEVVCHQGDAADGLYVVARGTFGVYVTDEDGAHEAFVAAWCEVARESWAKVGNQRGWVRTVAYRAFVRPPGQHSIMG